MNDENQNEYMIDLDGEKIPLDDEGWLDLECAVYGDLSDLVGLSDLKTVKKITIVDYYSANFNALKQLKSLEALYISNIHSGNPPLKLREFAGMTQLKELVISSHNIETIDHIDSLQKLERLRLHDCNISKVQGIQNLSSLKILDLSGNYIEKVFVKDLPPSLEELYMNSNEIIGLETHLNLKVINLQSPW